MEERIARLEAQTLAFGMALGTVIGSTWREKEDRAAARDLCCDSIESAYGRKLMPGGHERIQQILHELEELFQLAEGASKANL